MRDESYTDSFGAKVLMFAMIAGAALLFLEATWSPVIQGGEKHATVQTVTMPPAPQRLARN
ncbi:MAG: hypothetical protein WDM91_09290 [Rhizomicrobium sp.]